MAYDYVDDCKIMKGMMWVGVERYVESPVPNKEMQTSPSPLRSSHLDIKDEQCAETKNMLKKSYRVFELWASKRSKKMRKKLNFL